MKGINKKLWLSALFIAYLSLNYVPGFGWWISFLGTVLIVTFGRLAWPAQYRRRLGLPSGRKQYFITIMLLVLLIAVSYSLIHFITIQNELSIAYGSFRNFVHIFFYTLNEEMILGAILLISLKLKYSKLNALFISAGVALIFALLHYIFYRWIFLEAARGILSILTVFALFLIGLLRNNLILKTGHIGYSWALHFSWMAILFGCAFYQSSQVRPLSQSERFNLFIGNEITISIVLVLALLTSFWIRFNRPGLKTPA